MRSFRRSDQMSSNCHSLYLKLDLDSDQPFDPQLASYLEKYSGELHYLWFHVHSRRFAKSDPDGDTRCVEVLRKLSDAVKPFDVRIGIYHHVGLWAERFSDGVRIARKVERDNVGAVFNLCHYLKTVGPDKVETELGGGISPRDAGFNPMVPILDKPGRWDGTD